MNISRNLIILFGAVLLIIWFGTLAQTNNSSNQTSHSSTRSQVVQLASHEQTNTDANTASIAPASTPTPSPSPAPPSAIVPKITGNTLDIPLDPGYTIFDFAQSEDKHYIVFIAGTSAQKASLYSIPSAGGEITQLTTLSAATQSTEPNKWDFAISPQSDSVFYQDRDVLFRVPIAGGARKQVATGLGAAGEPGRDLTSPSYRSRPHVPDFQIFAQCQCLVYRSAESLTSMRLDGNQQRIMNTLPEGEGHYIYGYQVSDDGKWLVYDTRKFVPWLREQPAEYGDGMVAISAVYSVALPRGEPTLLASAPNERGGIYFYSIEEDLGELYFSSYILVGTKLEGFRDLHVPLSGGEPQRHTSQ